MTVASELKTTRQLNHVEMIYRPGERELATRVFELLDRAPELTAPADAPPLPAGPGNISRCLTLAWPGWGAASSFLLKN